ncbi:MAG: VWA domain-containing protein, partial [Gammaproteobacteria bacterium]|nr:VWA domain-containing protein [Gammaproteobacteria bacterium]
MFAFATSLASSLACGQAPENATMLVLDASGSMWGQIDGVTKIEIARDVVAAMVNDWNPEHHLGLIAYGHRREGDCDDIETLIPIGTIDAEGFRSTLNSVKPKGKTPLSAAVQQAASVLDFESRTATVILVSDGRETCGLDPCLVADQLEKAGIDFTAHVIGFDINAPQDIAQLECMAERTGGRY